MKVKIMYRNSYEGGDGWTYHPVEVEIADNCPVCGEPRGEPVRRQYCEDGEYYTVDNWENPCGHKDMYRDVWREARKLAAGGAVSADLDAARKRSAEARARADAATPGPWVNMSDTVFDGEIRSASDEGFDLIAVMPELDDRPEDFDFIARAREDVPELADLVDTLAAEAGRLAAERDNARAERRSIERKYNDIIDHDGRPIRRSEDIEREVILSARIVAAEAENVRLRKELEWYADTRNWVHTTDAPAMKKGDKLDQMPWTTAKRALAAQQPAEAQR